MILPPEPIDPTKDFFKELARYAVELVRYRAALEEDFNEHGPWKQEAVEPDPDLRRRYDDIRRLTSYDDRRAFYTDYGYF